MRTVSDIVRFVETLAPTYMKEDWDCVGLNCGRMDAPVDTVLVALDPFADACREAAEIGAQVLLTHHALLWKQQFITDQTESGRNALFLMEHKIAHINAHTNLDCAPGGVNDTLAAALGLSQVNVIEPVGTSSDGTPYGLLRTGLVPEQPLDEFLRLVRFRLHCEGLRYVSGGKPVRQVAVGGGSCASELEAAVRAGCDTFVTADVKYNQFWDARANGVNLIDAGHFYTENPVCRTLATSLKRAFPDLTVKLSEKHADCMKFFC